MENGPFILSQKVPLRDGVTISRDSGLGAGNRVTWFALGKGTSISRESYDTAALYLGGAGSGTFLLGEEARAVTLELGDLLIVPEKTLCGVDSPQGARYTELTGKGKLVVNHLVKSGEALRLKDLIDYVEGSVANLDIVKSDTMKFVVMAFDGGTGLQPHRAPGNAIVTALEGRAVIGYEGKEYQISEGESFRFDKNGLHSITAGERFKMSLLLVLD